MAAVPGSTGQTACQASALMASALMASALRAWALLAVALLGVGAAPATAQAPGDTLTVAAGPQYAAGPLRRLLHGSNWRELWVTPIRVPVLDVRTFAGGLEPLRRGGGNQTITLHVVDGQGRRWLFRSIDKVPGGAALPAQVQGTPAAAVIQDHTSILHPGGYFVLPALLDAVGVLYAQPMLFIMPDDAALGEYRADYAGMLGELELRPDEGPDDTPGFAGSRKIKSSANFLDDLESGHEHRLDEAELLRARLVDFLIGDTDRGTDQWRWARYGTEGNYIWRPIPADRDWALARADGLLARLVDGFYEKLVKFGDEFPSVETLTYSSHVVDRTLLTRLTREDVAEQVSRVQAAVTDSVIDRAVAAMPPEYVALSGAAIASSLRVRRDRLPQLAAEFYDWLATEVDVRGTDERDYAEVERRADGSVRVRIWPLSEVPQVLGAGPVAARAHAPAQPGAAAANGQTTPAAEAWYDRVFLPQETREVRVYLHGGADHARVVGVADGPITLRLIAGGGDDVLEDHAGNTRLYVARGDNRVVTARGTRVDGRRWYPPPPEEGLRAGSDWAPDFGSDRGVSPALSYGDRTGALLGVKLSATRYGFRRLPHHWDLDVRALYAPATGRFGADLELDHRLPNSRATLRLDARATSLESFRFHGFGNQTTLTGGERHGYDRVSLHPAVEWKVGRMPGFEPPADRRAADQDQPDADDADTAAAPLAVADRPSLDRLEGTVVLGPAFTWTRPRAGAPQHSASADGTGEVLQLGARAAVDLRRVDRRGVPRRGFRVQAESAVHPLVDGAGGFADVQARLAAYVPLIGDGPHLALLAGGARVFGQFPVWDAAFLGGRHSLRGSLTERWAGDASLYGAAELRVPLDTITLLIRTELGVFAFGDAGRVWYRNASPGAVQTGYGAGGWLSVFGRAVSVAVAQGESTRVHAWLGLPF